MTQYGPGRRGQQLPSSIIGVAGDRNMVTVWIQEGDITLKHTFNYETAVNFVTRILHEATMLPHKIDYCRHGHLMTEANTRYKSNGTRRCRTCDAAYHAKYYLKRKGEHHAAREEGLEGRPPP